MQHKNRDGVSKIARLFVPCTSFKLWPFPNKANSITIKRAVEIHQTSFIISYIFNNALHHVSYFSATTPQTIKEPIVSDINFSLWEEENTYTGSLDFWDWYNTCDVRFQCHGKLSRNSIKSILRHNKCRCHISLNLFKLGSVHGTYSN
jgi:hypothetical protein